MSVWKDWIGIELSVVSHKEKILSGIGGFLAILLLVLIGEHFLPGNACPVIASMGASAVLLFAVPHGQLSQPWPVIGGHALSALIGVACAMFIPGTVLAAALAVGLAIWAMHQFKCIHPPGGATALTAVLGGPAIRAMGFKFVAAPVLINAVAIVAIAVVFNFWFQWRRYPAALNRPGEVETTPAQHQEVLEALRSLDSFVDITEEDLVRLSEKLKSRKS